MGDASGAGARWQGYSHQELYDMLHSGPGSGAAGTVADTWSGLAGALSDIQQDISSGVVASGATWAGTAADNARGALGPLSEWARQAATAADVMRVSVELQGDLFAKARAAMPAPVPVPQRSQFGQLVTAQVDFEVTEMASQSAEQQAFQVMAQYEAATVDNTGSLGEFSQPPALVVDTTPVTGLPARRSAQFGQSFRSTGPRGGSATESTGSARKSTGVGSAPSAKSPATGKPAPRATATGAAQEEPTVGGTAQEETGHSTAGSTPADHVITTTPEQATSTAPPATTRTSSFAPAETHTVNSPVIGEPDATGPTTTPSSAGVRGRDKKTPSSPGAVSAPGVDRFSPGWAVVPTARRPDEEHEPDVHESKYFIEAEDIYGARQTYSPPVIGESRPRR